MTSLASRYRTVTADIAALADEHRRTDAVRLVAVGKGHAADKLAALARLGQRDFAENYAQEGVAKIAAVESSLDGDGLTWHFVGRIQRNKCKLIAESFDWVHSVDDIAVAEKLNRHRGGDKLNVLLQVNLDGDAAKGGVDETELPALATAVSALPKLNLCGLMAMPKPQTEFAKQRAVYRRCRELRDGLHLKHLSMGMSGDMAAAIAEGATMVRIGTAVFGPRLIK